MSGETDAEELYSAIEETARLVGAPCSREKIWPVLSEYRNGFAEGGVVFSAQAGEHHAGELDYGLAVPPRIDDPYAHALAHGFVTETDHPVAALLSDLRERCAVAEHFADCGVVGGFRKLYAHFPRDLQKVSELAGIPSMPRAVAENAGLFARYGLDNVVMIGVNYKSKTVSLYFQFTAESRPRPGAIRSMLGDIGMTEPDERMLEFASNSFRANITLGWDSPDILRVAFAPPPGAGLDLSTVPIPVGPHLENFVTRAPRAYTGERINLFAVKWTRDKEFLEVCSYYQLPAGYEPIRQMAVHKEQP
ncbi:aromatic prenyltransferase [Streptomyces sp. KMM 9044]|uniref:aromatic prenyltransferase n=1 Tax=Streptomyces sp. KMM 9044 TaxID=2744474 RepID=UPI002151B601|nr:aromatic prenyltransferase [Streptomyces sp. KMM 9044]WAX82231.1 aromatic prenyltransferase [Streptomyces sp. KMM 9044]